MNERIKKLEKQASDYYWSLDDDVRTADAFTQKFAELIIQDCIDCVDGYTKPRTFNTHYDAVEQIKANFGVE